MTDSKRCLKALAAFEKSLADTDAAKGTWVPPLGSGTMGDPTNLGYWVHSDLLNEFVKMLYREAWVDKGFVWRRWTLHRDAFITDHSRIMVASASDLRKLLTSIVRCDRFIQGYLEERLRDRTLYAIAKRGCRSLKGAIGWIVMNGEELLVRQLGSLRSDFPKVI